MWGVPWAGDSVGRGGWGGLRLVAGGVACSGGWVVGGPVVVGLGSAVLWVVELQEASLPSGEDKIASWRAARRCSISRVDRDRAGGEVAGLGVVSLVVWRMVRMKSLMEERGVRVLRLCGGIGGTVAAGGRGEHEVGAVDGVGVLALAVEVGRGGGLAGAMSRKKFLISSWVDSIGLSGSGVRVGECSWWWFRGSDAGGLRSSGEVVGGWFGASGGGGEGGGDVAWELQGDGVLGLACLSLMWARE